MAEDTWLKLEREMFLTKLNIVNDKDNKKVKDILQKYNAHLVRALFGESPYVAQNLKESLIKSQESE